MLFLFLKSSFPKENQWSSHPDSRVCSLQWCNKVWDAKAWLCLTLLPPCILTLVKWAVNKPTSPQPPSQMHRWGVLSKKGVCGAARFELTTAIQPLMPIFPALSSPAALPKTRTSLPRSSYWTCAISGSQRGCMSPVNLHCSHTSQMLLWVPPGNDSFSYKGSHGAHRLPCEPRDCLCWHMGHV